MEHIGLYLKDIFFKRKRGKLSFHDKNIQKYLFFQEGFLIFARTNHPEELLGEVLYRLGKLPEEHYKKIDEYIEPRKSIGQVLIEKGLISQESLREGLIYQMREIVLNAFSVFNGEFKYQEKKDLSEEVFDVKLKLPVLIEEGIRRMKYNPALKDFMSDRTPFSKSIDFYLRMTETERELLDKIKGDLTAEELLKASEINPQLFWKSLYLFYCLDLIDFKEKEEIAPQDKEEPAAEKADDRIHGVMEFHQDLPNQNYYQILGVSKDSSSGQIKKAYFRLARKYHPDLFGRDLPNQTIQKIDEVFDQITKAYQTLSNEDKRREYNHQMEAPPDEERKNIAKEAEKRFRQGKTLFDQGRYEEALIFLEEAIRHSQEKASIFLLLALTQAKIPIYRKQAEQNFVKATKLEPWNTEAYVGLGLLYKKEGLHIKAKKQFEKALKIDPDHKIARKELDADKRARGKKGIKDLFSFDLFGKKK
jgi:curved DNA-binding protein CbpA